MTTTTNRGYIIPDPGDPPATYGTKWATLVTAQDVDIQNALDNGYPLDSIVIVQHGDNDVANGTNLLDAYTAAKALTPGGLPLGADNRALLIVPAGSYDLDGLQFQIDTDFIDIQGHGICRRIAGSSPGQMDANSVKLPSTRIYGSAPIVLVGVSANDFNVKSIYIEQNSLGDAAVEVSESTGAPRSSWIDFAYKLADLSPTAGFKPVSPATKLAGYFEHCHCHWGFLWGEFDGVIKNSSAADYSIGALTDASGVGTFNGIAEDCAFAGNSVGFGDAGGIVGTSAVIRRCTVDVYCCGASDNTGAAAFNGLGEDIIASEACFGHAEGGEGSISGTLRRCVSTNVRSFAAGGSSGYGVIKTGAIIKDCEGDDYCFASEDGGSSSNSIETGSLLENCKGGANCFGGTAGSIRGKLINCETTNGFAGPNGTLSTAELVNCRELENGVGEADSLTVFRNFESLFRRNIMPNFAGKMYDSKIKTSLDSCVEVKNSNAHFYYCMFHAAGNSPLGTDSAYDVVLVHCTFDGVLDANFTNLVSTPYNVDSSAIEL